MEIGDHVGRRYGAIKAPVEEDPLLLPKPQKVASRRGLVVGILVVALVFAVQARKTPWVTTTTITPTEEGASSREEENITERQQPLANSNLARFEVQIQELLFFLSTTLLEDTCSACTRKKCACRGPVHAPVTPLGMPRANHTPIKLSEYNVHLAMEMVVFDYKTLSLVAISGSKVIL